MARENYVRFDWATKRLLRQKSNFVILEGFLSTLLGERIKIDRMLESEGNQQHAEDKFNRVDMLAENSKGELVIIEVQNNRELDYFHRMLYGVSKAITEYITKGEPYSQVKKVYSINIVYFDLGQGEDYVYHGNTSFEGIHKHDTLKLSLRQREQFIRENAGDLFPEYYVLRVNEFDKLAKTPLDEWIAFLKTGEIADNTKTSGLSEARELLRLDHLSPKERANYEAHLSALQYQRSVIQSGWIEGKAEGKVEGLAEGKAEGLAEGKAEGLAEGLAEGEKKKALTIAKQAKEMGMSIENILLLTGLKKEELPF
ncbi:Rpn family recombination-promoting nuclease/putative transposase [Butyricimonas faecalis]|uniref:Rpn family recombination-promoting nuclease/putative transposase n=1 Tax=Butyricimonas faecalis TaxID=2093856 RepID=A0A3S9VRQ9_9BACT|nr:Rpn family recombination-promoting nuclease/putative transposase [Butyricimonas faecalis]AZS29263.1 Rpn family recombination-promoting nuclease/putative transposase [Butyricimonas faecalis]